MRSELHPAVQTRLEQTAQQGVPRPAQLSVAGARRQTNDVLDQLDLPAETEPVDTVDEYAIPGPRGSESDVRIRTYTPMGNHRFRWSSSFGAADGQ